MIRTFKHKGLERFFQTRDLSGIQPKLASRIERLLDALDVALEPEELNVPGWYLHRLQGDKKNLWSLRVSGNWRMTFEFDNGEAYIVNLEDYH